MVFSPKSYQNKGNWKKGELSEKRFKEYMESIGIKAEKTSTHIDKNYHVDFIVGEKTPVDLKGDKNTDAVWLEKRNVWGGKGSLYGFAKYMVIEYIDIKYGGNPIQRPMLVVTLLCAVLLFSLRNNDFIFFGKQNSLIHR